MKLYRLGWSWKPSSDVTNAIKRGNGKFRKPELPPHRIEEMKMETNTASHPVAGSIDPRPRAARVAAKKVTKKAGAKKVVKKVAKAKAAPAKKADPDLVPLKAICAKLEIEPRLARRKLRKADLKGHDPRDRWTFKKGSPAYAKVQELLSA